MASGVVDSISIGTDIAPQVVPETCSIGTQIRIGTDWRLVCFEEAHMLGNLRDDLADTTRALRDRQFAVKLRALSCQVTEQRLHFAMQQVGQT